MKMPQRPEPKTVQLDPTAVEYQRILGGPPESVTMRSGYVVLQPGSSVGRHNTDTFEEMLVVLDGEGEMILGDGTALPLKPYVVAYCPTETEHDVRNTGSRPLRYVYVVAMGKETLFSRKDAAIPR
jgi:mannose-6-phosphate isomerase-like protein (cupin superfamily)